MKAMTRINNRNSHFQAGASMIEGVAFLGVAAIVLVTAVMMMTNAFSGANTNKALQEVTGIRTNVKKLYMGQAAGFGTGSLNATLSTAKQFPSTLSVSGATVNNAWNGAVTITGNTSTFDISYAAVPQEVCTNLVSAQGSSGWNAVAVNGAAALTPPITPTQAGTACNAATNTIVWTAS